MSDDFEARHVKAEHYELTRQGGLSASALVRLIHDHILSGCEQCRAEWERLQESRPEVRALLSQVGRPQRQEPAASDAPRAQKDGRYTTAFSAAARQLEDDVRTLRKDRRRARRELRLLLDTPADERHDKIFSARTRFRSRAFAEILLREARRQVRNAPREAENLASLVPVVLRWTPGAHGTPWALALEAQARAHVANALRVRGDLIAAQRHFSELRRDLAAHPLDDPEANGEITSLEASFRTAQRRFEEAGELLDRAELLFRHAGLREGQARVLIQRANLLHGQDHFDAALQALDDASQLLDPKKNGFLFTCTVTSRVLCLTELNRFDEAWKLLQVNLAAYESDNDPWTAVYLRNLQGRVLVGLERYEEAEQSFAACREGAMVLGRHYDAALATLDLAHVYLKQDRMSDLEELSAGLVSTFRARGVSREALASLTLLQQAVSKQCVTYELIDTLRHRINKLRSSATVGTHQV